MKPLRDRVIIKPDAAPTEKSGFFIVETWKTLPQSGEVTAVGPEVKTVKPGDHVYYNRYGAVRVEVDSAGVDTLQVCKESHIYGVEK